VPLIDYTTIHKCVESHFHFINITTSSRSDISLCNAVRWVCIFGIIYHFFNVGLEGKSIELLKPILDSQAQIVSNDWSSSP
jgi:hypothetical protein